MARMLLVGISSFLVLVLGLVFPAQAEVLTIGGTGSASPLIQLLFDEFRKQNAEVFLKLISPPLGTNGALKALSLGRVDITIIGRPVASDELKDFGQTFHLADTPFVMASLDGQRPRGFTLDELAKVYEGSLQAWDSGKPLRLVLRGTFESDTLLLKTMSSNLERAVTLSNQRPGMAGAGNDLEAARLIASTPDSLGPTTLGLLITMGLQVKLFPLNGVAPSLANLKNGTYPWHKALSVALAQRPSPAATVFAAFLRGPKAKAMMLRNGYLPAP